MRISAKQISLSGLFISLGIVVPFLFHQFGLAGRIFSPMHFPVFLAGILLGPLSGAVVGLLSPILSFFLTGMPPPYAVPLMASELPVYGLTIGLFCRYLKAPLIVNLLVSMVAGRIAFALGIFIMGAFVKLPVSFISFLEASFITGLPGIFLQLIIIPALAIRLKKIPVFSGKL
ncbi:MAG: ECF transporter S component [candidate division Zixibacteria bacterium]|nr:ECF transporter S component [candidate division Zixibacteria bacterium]